jgi:hypothetical protein
MRFLQNDPFFSKGKSGRVTHHRVGQLLNQLLYAGYIEHRDWGVSLRPAQHEPLISFETYQRIQERLNGIQRTPMRKNLDEHFPLRGFVLPVSMRNPAYGLLGEGQQQSLCVLPMP